MIDAHESVVPCASVVLAYTWRIGVRAAYHGAIALAHTTAHRHWAGKQCLRAPARHKITRAEA